MARGKYLSLEEARKLKLLNRFCKEHPSVGDRDRFERLLDAMAPGGPPTSKKRRKPKNSEEGGQT